MNCRHCEQPIMLGRTVEESDWIHNLRAVNASSFTGLTPCVHRPGGTVAEPPELALYSWTVAYDDPDIPKHKPYRSKLVANYAATDDAKAKYHAERHAAELKRLGYENVHIFHDGPIRGNSEAKTGWAPLYVFTFAERFLADEVIETYGLGKWWRGVCPHKPNPEHPTMCQFCREAMPRA